MAKTKTQFKIDSTFAKAKMKLRVSEASSWKKKNAFVPNVRHDKKPGS